MPHIVLQTDFGASDPGILNLHGVCKSVSPHIGTFDLSHSIPKFDVAAASRSLAEEVPYWPEETVFVSAVVDPARPAAHNLCVAKTSNNRYIVAPDNGTLRDVERKYGIEWIRDLSDLRDEYWEAQEGGLCHGRDFAYCAARVTQQLPDMVSGTPYPCGEIVK